MSVHSPFSVLLLLQTDGFASGLQWLIAHRSTDFDKTIGRITA
ncbi:hypothetical protein SynPROSU1_01102 [Synechococcus sp. PROS-U-1]|nr:hypothetical protein SynPROSU1_01102 [Synechococcus sp. PROS-U-1]